QLAQEPPQRVAAVQLVAAEAAHHQDSTRPEVGGQVGDQVASGAVGPVQVLHHPQQRPPGGQSLDQPQQQLEQTAPHGRRTPTPPPCPAPATAAPAAAASPPQGRSGSSRASSCRAGPATAASSAGSS